jgi:hypothetical protein
MKQFAWRSYVNGPMLEFFDTCSIMSLSSLIF